MLMICMFFGLTISPFRLITLNQPTITTSNQRSVFIYPNTNPNSSLLEPHHQWTPDVQDGGYHARQLLSVEDNSLSVDSDIYLTDNNTTAKEDNRRLDSHLGITGRIEPTEKLMSRSEKEIFQPNVKETQFWIDDLITNYKKESLSRIIDVLHETPSLPLQRILRRKLKEELGIRFPLPERRRIAYNPPSHNYPPPPTTYNHHPSTLAHKLELKYPTDDVIVPPPPPCVKNNNENDTEFTRVADDLNSWVERQNIYSTSNELSNDQEKSYPTSSAPKHGNQHSQSENGVVLYDETNAKLHTFMDALNRRNDSIYIISITQDNIIIPALTSNFTGRSKVTFVLPAISPNDTLPNDSTYQMLMELTCEVLSTKYTRIKRDLLPWVLDHSEKEHQHTTATNKKGTRTTSNGEKSSSNPKSRAFHGNKKKKRKLHNTSDMTSSYELSRSHEDGVTVSDVHDL